jgi:hypothetical protein
LVPEAHAHRPADHDRAGAPGRDKPIALADVDRSLRESAAALTAGDAEAIRFWRVELARSLETLRYARTILGDDVTMLRHATSSDRPTGADLVGDLPGVLARTTSEQPPEPAEQPEQPGPPGPPGPSLTPEDRRELERAVAGLELDPGLFTGSALLVAAHEEMADVDLHSPGDVARVLGLLEGQVAALAARQATLEDRLFDLSAFGAHDDDDVTPPPTAS